jgi:hypothetical protein
MSYNPAFDPRSDQSNQNAAEQQARADQQYAREMRDRANSQPPFDRAAPPNQVTYNATGGVYAAPTPAHSASVAAYPVTSTEVNTYSTPRLLDRVRWGPVWAGLLSALAALVLLSLFGVAVGLTAATGDPNGAAGAAANNGNNYAVGAGIWAVISAIIAFFIGGFVAASTTRLRGRDSGWINGAMVWALALPILLWLAGSGAVGFLNAIGFNLQGFASTVSNAVANPSTTDPAAVQRATDAARTGAWWALVALVLGLIAAGLGGLLGERSKRTGDDVVTGNVERRI